LVDESVMFAVEWLKEGVTVETETSALADLADAVATTRARANAIAARHPSASGAVLITFKFVPGVSRHWI
jgi:hypothetical protein